MKSLIVCSLIALSVTAFAEGDKKEENFAERKTEMLAGIDKRIAAMQEHKTCVTAATEKDSMKKCHEKMKEFRMENRAEHMEMRHERMGDRMKKQKERMDKKSDKN